MGTLCRPLPGPRRPTQTPPQPDRRLSAGQIRLKSGGPHVITGWAGPGRGKEGGGGEPGGGGLRRRRREGARGGARGGAGGGVGNGGKGGEGEGVEVKTLPNTHTHTSRRRERPVFKIIFTDPEKGSHALLKMCLGARRTSHIRSGLRNCPVQARNRIPLPHPTPATPPSGQRPRGSSSASVSLSVPAQGANIGTRLRAASGGKGRVTERRA